MLCDNEDRNKCAVGKADAEVKKIVKNDPAKVINIRDASGKVLYHLNVK